MADIVLAGNTSGTLTLSAPSIAGTSTLNLPASSGTVLDDASVGVCRAWVFFNGVGTVTINGSFNVSSLTDLGVGNYRVNFTNAMTSANYSCVTGSWYTGVTASMSGAYSYLTTSVSVSTTNPAGSAIDVTQANYAIFR